jgi:PAS domain S-box-containing protein
MFDRENGTSYASLGRTQQEAVINRSSSTAPLSDDAQAILEGMSDAFYALDGEWRIIYANQRALAFWRATAADVIGHVIWQRFPSMVGSLNEQVLRQVRDEQRVITFEAPSPTTGIWVAVSIGPSGDGVSVYWRDISDRVEAENALRSFAEKLERQVADRTRALSEAVEELRQSRARYSAIFEHSPVDLVFLAVRPDGRVVCEDANPAWEHHTGYPRALVVGKTPEEVLPPEQAEVARIQYRRAIETRQPAEYEYTVQFPIGEVSRRSYLVPLLGDSGEVEHVLLTAVDLTETRRVEAQLRQAQKMEAIGQLTGGIAHDFNNLLTAVIGNLELLQSRITDARSSSMVEAALRSAMRGGQLTQQLLAHARKQNLLPRPVDVNAVIDGMSDLLQHSLGGLVQVETQLAADLWPAICDPAQLELVVLNLGINARDAMPEGGGLRIATNNVSKPEAARIDELDPGDYVRVAVIDSGVGMTPEVQERAFEPFFTTKEIGRGSGLGLAQVYGVVKQFGGTVRLVSTPGAGTTVDVFLPRAPSSASGAMSAKHQVAAAPDGHGTILVVDDDPDVREIAAIFLRQAGYVVREAGSGPEAKDILAEGPVSLALVDYAMPMMSGVEFARVAREIQPDLPIVYITGAINMLGPDGDGLGDPVVVKPYSRATLLKMVREMALSL